MSWHQVLKKSLADTDAVGVAAMLDGEEVVPVVGPLFADVEPHAHMATPNAIEANSLAHLRRRRPSWSRIGRDDSSDKGYS